MAMTSDRLPATAPADNVSGSRQGHWTYKSYAALPDDEKLQAYAKSGVPEYWIAEPGTKTVEVLVLHAGAYRSLGIFRGQASLPSRVAPEIAEVPVEQFFSIK